MVQCLVLHRHTHSHTRTHTHTHTHTRVSAAKWWSLRSQTSATRRGITSKVLGRCCRRNSRGVVRDGGARVQPDLTRLLRGEAGDGPKVMKVESICYPSWSLLRALGWFPLILKYIYSSLVVVEIRWDILSPPRPPWQMTRWIRHILWVADKMRYTLLIPNGKMNEWLNRYVNNTRTCSSDFTLSKLQRFLLLMYLPFVSETKYHISER